MRRFLILVPAFALAVPLACGENLAASEDPAPDASVDASSAEVDGPSPPPGVDAGWTFCSDKADAAWCEDFDRAKTIDEIREASSNQSGLEKPKLTTISFQSAPQALQFTLPPDRPPVQSTLLGRAFETDKATMRLELDMRIGVAAPGPGQVLQVLVLKKGMTEAQLNRQCGSSLDDGGAPDCTWFVSTCVNTICQSEPLKPIKALENWTHVVLEATFGSTGHVKLIDDGMTVVDSDQDLSAPSNDKPSAIVALASMAGPSTYIEMVVDNVVVTLH